jgi:hypothetical protein
MLEYLIPADKVMSPGGAALHLKSHDRLTDTLAHYREQLNRPDLSEGDADVIRRAHAEVLSELQERANGENESEGQ